MSSNNNNKKSSTSASSKSAKSPTKSLPTKNSVVKKPPPPGPKYITTPTPITVHLFDALGSKTKSLAITLPDKTIHAVAEIKRLIAKETGIKAIDQRLVIDGGIDNFSVPLTVKLYPRTPIRQLTQSLIIRTFKETDNNEVYSLTIDPSDTIIDIKFLLEPLLSIPAEFIRLYYKYPGQPSRTLLNNDGKSIKEYQIPNKAVLKILFEYPSFTVGHGPSHRSAINFTLHSASNYRTVGEQFRFISNKCAKKPFLGTRSMVNEEKKIRGDYEWLSYQQVGNRVSAIGAGLRVIGAKKGDCIGIMSNNRSEWIISDYSCACQGFISVPLYDTLGPDAVEFIINHSSIKIVVVNYQQLKAITAIKNKCPSLTHIIIMDDFAFEKKSIAALKDKENIIGFSQLEEIGKKNVDKYPDNMPSPDDLYTLSYTSGTTGNPKGAMIKHSAIISGAASMDERLPSELRGEDEVTFSYLPLAHIYERVLQIGVINKGYATGFSQGDTTKLVEDVAALRPTFFPGVPRVWQRVYDRILAQIDDSNIIRRTLFSKAMDSKLSNLHQGNTDPIIWDKIVFNKLAERFGGRLKCMSTGAAPLSHTIAEFMRCAFQAYFVEGYGMTETCAAISVTSVDDVIYGVVGTPQSCCEIKLVDVPDMEYYSANNVGEIWVRGPQLFSGYYKQPDVTAETLTTDGWLATGDIGCWLEDGSLKIIDRKKNLFKLAQGEYISPEKIESVYKQVPLLQSIYVHGDSTETYCVAIGVPEGEGVKHWAEYHGMKDKSVADIIKSPQFIDSLHKQMDEAAKKEQLRGFEIVKRIYLSLDDFSVESGLMTPTFKLRRHAIAEKYAKQIADMYQAGEPNNNNAIKAKL